MSDTTIARPHSPGIEERVLGVILIDPETINEIDLLPDDFYIQRNRMIYQAIMDLRRDGQEINFVTVCDKLQARAQLSEVGGTSRVSGLLTLPEMYTFQAESYANILRKKSVQRRILSVSEGLLKVAFKDDGLEDGVADAMDNLSRLAVTHAGAVHISHYASQVYDEVLDAYSNPREIYGIETGIADFDGLTGGMQRAATIRLAGEPGVGKSAFAAAALIGAAEKGNACAYYAMEMKGASVVRRLLAARAKIPTVTLRKGKMTDDDWGRFTQAVEHISGLPFFLSDYSMWTTASIRADLQRLKTSHDIKAVAIDYEGLLQDDLDKDDITRSKIISGRVHSICKDLDVAGIILDDMNKTGFDNGSAGKGSISGSARKAHDADVIILMRKHPEIQGWVRLTWEKDREDSPDKFLDLKRAAGWPAFEPTTKQEPQRNNGRRLT
jgi:replicative DNA helicase